MTSFHGSLKWCHRNLFEGKGFVSLASIRETEAAGTCALQKSSKSLFTNFIILFTDVWLELHCIVIFLKIGNADALELIVRHHSSALCLTSADVLSVFMCAYVFCACSRRSQWKQLWRSWIWTSWRWLMRMPHWMEEMCFLQVGHTVHLIKVSKLPSIMAGLPSSKVMNSKSNYITREAWPEGNAKEKDIFLVIQGVFLKSNSSSQCKATWKQI